MSDVETRLIQLEKKVQELEDINAIRRLQWAYGYYIDYNRPEEVAGLFAKDGVVVFLSGEYVGYEGVMRLYGTWFQNLFTGGRRGPVHGLLLDHFQLQDIITIGEDGQTAKGRFRGILAGGWHDDALHEKPEGVPQQFWESGIYENDYVKEDGVWKIKRLDYMMQWQGDYEKGWAHTTAHLQPAQKPYPEDPNGPDRILPEKEVRQTWPHRYEVPMSFAHPVLGRAFIVENFTPMMTKHPRGN
ncbi:MAG: nuclear transport factor 2 family protein [Alphaproteobacteria bacterium]|nr:nuclear transport factor 2 family protein [Alphaproteobacteria bacterium]MBU0876149.1 nuclear transport factor 2 family protein [Alphaproteobacteria bacterium]MBU1768670.1 nuclear transport factor 2 family protein [Alphaproteobacteria bacterium]